MQNKKLLKTIFTVLIYICWSVFMQLPLNLLGIKLQLNMMSLYEFILTLLLLVLIFLIYKDELIKEFKLTNKKQIKCIFINVLIIFFIMGFSNMISYSILNGNIISSINNSGVSAINTKNLALIIRLLILSPIIEELVFRKSVRTIINNDVFFILFSGLLLGSLYVIAQTPSLVGILSSISYILVGLYLSYSYTKTNNILINILSRIIYNLLMLVIIL
mgnify:CR=1 FL=1